MSHCNGINILLIGDINGKYGRRAVSTVVPRLRQQYGDIHFVIANGENAAAGFGLTEGVYNELKSAGVNVVTMGNHTWDNRGILSFLDKVSDIIRPANYPQSVPGRGYGIFTIPGTEFKVAVINLLGRTLITPTLNCPFASVNEIVENVKGEVDWIFVDLHAEATSEKCAMGWFLDGRVTCVFGTHTHVQTNDARMLKHGTAYVTDLGMTGGHDGVIGVKVESVLPRFLTGMPTKFEVCAENPMLHGAMITLNPETREVIAFNLVKESMTDG